MRYVVLFVLFFATINAKYLDNHSCKECHEKIYEEYQSSIHSKSYFTDELHRKIANKVSTKTYECAVCHMPMSNNLADLMDGKARPNPNNITQSDGVSCYFCHTIAYVKKSHKYNINTKSRQAEGYKPTLYGRLINPDESDKHSSVKNPIYAKKVCMGCHSHKLNDNNVTIFRAMSDKQDSLSCIKCHMPQASGGVEKMDKRARGVHVSHKFLGIRDKEFRKKGLDINVSINNNQIVLSLHNKTTHPLIIQPARAKYLRISQIRDGKVIWQNYKNSPKEDKKSYFAYSFKANNHPIVIPATATSGSSNNIEANATKVLKYTPKNIKKGDTIKVDYFVQLAKDDCASVINLTDKSILKPQLIKTINYKVK
jgi:nitrate reductase cytochrome c-type subunit